MCQDAKESLTLDELIQHAHGWLYERKILIPAERTLRDLGRSIWAEIEQSVLAMIEAVVPQTAGSKSSSPNHCATTATDTASRTFIHWSTNPSIACWRFSRKKASVRVSR